MPKLIKESLMEALQKLTKWRAVFAGWQLGTRPSDDPECQAVRDHREITILLRAELSALLGLLFRKEIVTEEEFLESLLREAMQLDKDYEQRFPGFTTSQQGLHMDPKLAAKTMRGWKP